MATDRRKSKLRARIDTKRLIKILDSCVLYNREFVGNLGLSGETIQDFLSYAVSSLERGDFPSLTPISRRRRDSVLGIGIYGIRTPSLVVLIKRPTVRPSDGVYRMPGQLSVSRRYRGLGSEEAKKQKEKQSDGNNDNIKLRSWGRPGQRIKEEM